MSIRQASDLAKSGQIEEAAMAYARIMFITPGMARSVIFNLRKLVNKLREYKKWSIQTRTIAPIQLQIGIPTLVLQSNRQGPKQLIELALAACSSPCSLLFVPEIRKREDVLCALLHRLIWQSEIVFPTHHTNSLDTVMQVAGFYAKQWLYPAENTVSESWLTNFSRLSTEATNEQIDQVRHLELLETNDMRPVQCLQSISGPVASLEVCTVQQLAVELCETDSEVAYVNHVLQVLNQSVSSTSTKEADETPTDTRDWMSIAIERGLFCDMFYKEMNPDLPSGLNLATHFRNTGWREGRDPSQYFSITGYKVTHLKRHPIDICPLEHFVHSESNRQKHPSSYFDHSRSRHHDCVDFSVLRAPLEGSVNSAKIAILIHIHYSDSLGKILDHVSSLGMSVDLLISTTSQQVQNECHAILKASSFTGCAIIRITENRGRDICAFVHCFTDKYLHYDLVCKIHSKKSPHLKDFGTRWFEYLLESTLGSKELVAKIIRFLSESASNGILAPIPFTGTNNREWAGNLELAQGLVAEFSTHDAESLKYQQLYYPSGSVFWFKPKALVDLYDRYKVEDFPAEPLPVDGTISHAIERLFPYYASRQGLSTIYYKDRAWEIRASKEIAIHDFIANIPASGKNRKKKVLIFSHEASNTGAPRTAIGIHAALCQSEDYESLAILLEGGPLEEAFTAAGPTLVFTNGLNIGVLADILQAAEPEILIICNTCVTAGIGRLARNYGHRVISLVHENASAGYWPKEFFVDALQADVSVFPGASVLEAAVASAGILPANEVFLKPQGIYRDTFPEVSKQVARASVRSELGLPENTMIILGCGMLEKRKGIDIFIDTALLMGRDPCYTQSPLCFLWIGAVPTSDKIYAESQLQRLEASDHGTVTIMFLGEAMKVDRYFAASDIFFLSSRFDPFPGVVLEAMASALPIVCFKQATEAMNAFINQCGGFAVDITTANDAVCVIKELLGSCRLRREMGDFSKTRLNSEFMFNQYIKSLFMILRPKEQRQPLHATKTNTPATSSAHGYHFSIVVPAHNTPLAFMQQMIESVIRQTYEDLELIIAASELSSAAVSLIEYYANTDPRIKPIFLNTNLGIAGNTNSALSLKTGSHVCFLDHDDMLHAKCLERVARSIDSTSADFLYTDEDKVDISGALFYRPVRKPEFSHRLLESHNFVTHLSIVSSDLLDKIGKLSSAYEGAQDYDFVLRATELAQSVVHIPEVLYHWREHQDSTSVQNSGAKAYAIEAGRKALEARLKRQGRVHEEVATTQTPFQYSVMAKAG